MPGPLATAPAPQGQANPIGGADDDMGADPACPSCGQPMDGGACGVCTPGDGGDGEDAKQTSRTIDSRETGLLSEFSALVQAPQFLMAAFREMAADRAYVYRDAMLLNTQDTVAVNHVLRNQIVSLAYLGVSDPQPFCQPARQAGLDVAFPTELFSRTMEIHLSQQVEQMDFARKLEGACQDASTNRQAILKVVSQSDYMKDPVGRDRFGDIQEQVAHYTALKARIDEGDLAADGADGQRLKDLDSTIRTFMAGKLLDQIKSVVQWVPGPVPLTDAAGNPVIDPATLQPQMTQGLVPNPTDPREMHRQALIAGELVDLLGCSELEQYVGFKCEQILPEDFRWDWSITRPEDCPYGDWQAHRTYMLPDDICAKWGVDREALYNGGVAGTAGNRRFGYGSTNSTAQDPNWRLDIEGDVLNDRIAVWELWHRKNGRRYVFVQGMRRFLVNEVPQAVGSRFYPFFHIFWNRVTGQALPISDVQLSRNLQDEINMLRSHDREARRAAYPVLFVPRNLLDAGAREQYRNRLPFSVIECNNADEVKKYFAESATVPYDPKLYDTSRAESQLQMMFGIPLIVTGAGGNEDMASAYALSKEGLETGTARRRLQVNRVITDIFKWMAEISLKVFSENAIKQTCGPLGVWPRLSTEELYTRIQIEIKGGLQGQPRAKDRLDLWTNFANIAQSLQLPVNGIEVLRELLDVMNIRTDFTRFLMIPQPPMPGLAGPGGPGGPGGPPMPGSAPGTPGGGPPMGGAPTMVDRGAPSSLAQIPNHPPLGVMSPT